MQTKNLANNFMLFSILIRLYTYLDLLKEKPLLRKSLNSESTAYCLDDTFYHTHTPILSSTIPAAIVIKASKYSMYFIVHNACDVATKYSIISTEKMQLSYLVGSVDKNNVYFHTTCLLPNYWKLLPPSHTFIDHAVKLQIINLTVCLKYYKQKTKRNLQRNNRSWQSEWNLSSWNTLDNSTMTNTFT